MQFLVVDYVGSSDGTPFEGGSAENAHIELGNNQLLPEFDENLAGVSTNLEEIRRMVMAGIGIGALPIHVAERDVRDGLLFRLPPYADPPAIDIWLLRHPGASVNRAEAEFTRLLLQRIEQTPREQRIYGLSS